MKFGTLFLVFVMALSVAFVHTAEARTRVGIHIGGGYYDPYWGPYAAPYPPYYPAPPVIVAPPPVVYAPPPVAYVAPAPVQETIPANQTSPTYMDDYGRTCREYQTMSVVGGHARDVTGTACLQPDGTWRIVD